MTADARYEILVRKAKLYGQAFFGWTATPEEAAQLNKLWAQVMEEHMVFWKHNNDLSKPPELEDLLRRRPDGLYWESAAPSKEAALETFWIKWKRKTGKDYPRDLPRASTYNKVGFTGNQTRGSRRPSHHAEKNEQDACG